MLKLLTVCAGAMVAILLLSSDASAFGRRQANCSAPVYAYSGAAYGGTAYGAYGTAYGSAAPAYAYSGTQYGTYGAAYGGYAPNYGYGYGGGYDFGRPGYNPGGLGGPRSGLGVRPGVGFGGFGVRR